MCYICLAVEMKLFELLPVVSNHCKIRETGKKWLWSVR